MGDTTVTGSTSKSFVLKLKIQWILISCAGVLVLYKRKILLGIFNKVFQVDYCLCAVDSFIFHKYSPLKPF